MLSIWLRWKRSAVFLSFPFCRLLSKLWQIVWIIYFSYMEFSYVMLMHNRNSVYFVVLLLFLFLVTSFVRFPFHLSILSRFSRSLFTFRCQFHHLHVIKIPGRERERIKKKKKKKKTLCTISMMMLIMLSDYPEWNIGNHKVADNVLLKPNRERPKRRWDETIRWIEQRTK